MDRSFFDAALLKVSSKFARFHHGRSLLSFPKDVGPSYNPTTPLVGYEITKDGVNRVLIMQRALTFTWKTWILAVPHVTCVRSVKQLLLT